MNIFEVCERFNLSLLKARKMDKAGVLRLDENTPEIITEIRHWLSRGQPLTAAHLTELIDNPGSLLDLGKYSDRAEILIATLGPVKREAAPLKVAAYITDAAKNDPDAVQIIVDWIKSILPASPVSHNYIAVRLLLGLDPLDRPADIPRVPRVLLNCRKHPDFAGYWRTEQNKSRSVTIYQKPKKGFDL
jgi:hypothetical protein